MSQTTLKMCSMTLSESTLFQERTKKWLEEVLETNMKKSVANVFAPAATNGNEKQGPAEIEAFAPKVTVTEFQAEILAENEKRPFPRQSPILKIKVKSQAASGNSTDHLIVKLLDDEDDGEFDNADNFGKRELNFYTKAVPDLLAWAASRGRKLKFGLPNCYFGNYVRQSSQAAETEEAEREETLLLDTKSALVLEDLSEVGFSPTTSRDGLRREELRCALREMAMIHAVSWAYQQETGEDLGQKYDLCEDVDEFVNGFMDDIEESFPKVTAYLLEPDVAQGQELLRRLERLKDKAHSVLRSLLTPPPADLAPSCLIHMDFWDQNLVFKDAYATSGGIGIQARILDWRNIMIGSPTHDLACILFTSINPIYRSFNTSSLLEYYWKAFKDTAASLKVTVPYSFDTLKAEYVKSKHLPLLVMLGSVGLVLDKPDNAKKFIQIVKELVETNVI